MFPKFRRKSHPFFDKFLKNLRNAHPFFGTFLRFLRNTHPFFEKFLSFSRNIHPISKPRFLKREVPLYPCTLLIRSPPTPLL